MNRTKQILSQISLLGLILVFLVGCGSGNQEKKEIKDDSTTIAKQVKKIVYPLPTPLEIAKMLENAKAGFIFDLVNPVKNVDKYSTEKSRALNLGIYGADLSYASTYNKAQEVTKLLTCSKKLSDALEINTPFAQKLQKRIDENINNKDSIYKIVSDSYYDTFDYLNTNNKGAVSVLILTGGWIEGLYLSSTLVATTKDNEEIIKGIANQKKTAETLVNLMNQYKENKDVADAIVDITKVKDIFDKVEGDKMTKEQFTAFSKAITEIRAKVIQLP